MGRFAQLARARGVRGRRGLIVVVVAVAALSVLVAGALADVNPQPVSFTHNGLDAAAPVAGGVFGSGPADRPGTAACTTATQSTDAGGNVNTDCAGPNGVLGPHNETSVAVNPTNTANIVGGANDYQLGIDPGGHVTENLRSYAHVSMDGGRTWSMYPVNSNSAYQATGDPSLAFDATGHAYYATLGFRFVGPGNATNPDVLVSNSADGGVTWDTSRIASGSGTATSVGDLLDKEYVTAWGSGNALVTYGDFPLAQKGAFTGGFIYSSVTHDYGKSWSKPQIISGSLNQAFVSVPTVAADGSVYVSFLNTTDLNTGRDDYEVVRLDPVTGARVAGPFKVAQVIDGVSDYPVFGGRQTYQDSVFRTWAAGNITADPTNATHLAVVWSDTRNTPPPVPSDPYVAKTNSDVIVSQSFDSGRTWSAPTSIALAGDQFMPWGAYDGTGKLRIGFFDRHYDTANHLYKYSLATETTQGSLTFTTAPVATESSNPTSGDRWFRTTANPAFPGATQFLGDYSNIAIIPTGTNSTSGTGINLGTGVVAYWTDMRNIACFPATSCGFGEDAYFARIGG